MLLEHLGDFLSHPFDPNNDGQTSAGEWFAFIGLISIIAYVWFRLLSYLLED